MIRPAAVLISDIHFNVNTLEVASAALSAAIRRANKLKVPLIIAGDLNDTKAIIRAEVANRLLSLLAEASVKTYILVGNHDLINEKGVENGLNYLSRYANIVRAPVRIEGLHLIPYQTDPERLERLLRSLPEGETVIMHQGFRGAAMGDYVVDKTSISPQEVNHLRVYSGHYHRHQTFGMVTYIGSPYTVTFGEANDGPKGFLILNSDSSFTREILNLKAHRIFERSVDDLENGFYGKFSEGDSIWLKVKGPKSELAKINKNALGQTLFGHSNYKLDKIADDAAPLTAKDEALAAADLMDKLIDSTSDSVDNKSTLKRIWREILG